MPVTAIILAAGLGSRLGPRTQDSPKCLTPVCGAPILGRSINALRAAGVDDLVLVVGYLAPQIECFVNTTYPAPGIRLTTNPAFADSGTALSLLHGLDCVAPGRDVLVVEGDVVFEPALVEGVLRAPGSSTALASYRPDLSGTFALVGPDGRVEDWCHESVRGPAFPLEASWKTVNLTKLDAGVIERFVRPVLADTLAAHGPRATFETVARECIARGMRVEGVDVGDLPWYEIDTPADLAFASRLFSPTALRAG
jgi:choline kinase